ncbi:MAG: SH3 domain-containing protein [Candidatus Treponema excrementipullorum]|nr:SH3 domain-containing protein [Spirochaetia bacterium]MDY2755052.1 SH3 domain-containing protein [Candidatus Treponema excrementipullorum]
MKVFYLPVFVFFFVFGIACQKNDKATVVLQDTSIEKYPQTEKSTSNTNLAVTVTDNNVHIRNQPHLDGEILGTLTSGTVGTVLAESHLRMIHGETHPWYKVKTADGITGWIYGKYLSGDCVSVINQEYYQFPSVSNLNSGELAYSLMEFQYVENNGSTAVITLDTSLAQLEKTFGASEFRPGIQEDGKGNWNPYAGFPQYAWNGMEVAVIPHMIKVFSEDDISYIEKEDDPIIRIIDITGNEFKTSLGAGSGTDKLDVIDLYGKPYSEQDNFITYISGSIMGTAYLTFTFDSNERVEGMSLYLGD